ncbi:flavin reductase (DIM6/NTAB) family NADH-FMN oxidoreductase RutF [Bacilli bacterium PM5-3]|nr:flavin reductase (DIM6/NTAB) family NADH-FMN oxidoreductase RutF [Bacilli bacterium PM5-3]
MTFREISPNEINENIFKLFHDDWALVSASYNNKANTMTASWGFVGIMWHKPVAQVFIRPSRYTKEFVDNSDYFTVSFFDKEFRDDLTYLGTVSGKNEDKISKSSLTLINSNNIPYFNEAKLVLICKKLYVQNMVESSFMYDETIENNYPYKDYHTSYIGEIINVLKKEK